jgi:tetratricopeptide (TPR) repeat protein
MIDVENMIKTFRVSFLLLFLLTFSLPGYNQAEKPDGSSFGHNEDSISCFNTILKFQQFFSMSDYSMALIYWKPIFNECPGETKNIYPDGIKIYQYLLDSLKNNSKKKDYSDTLMLIYERQIEYYGEKGIVRGYQGVDLLKYRRNDGLEFVQQGYQLLNEAIELKGYETFVPILPNYLSASLFLYQSGLISDNKTIEDFLCVSDIMETLIATNPDDKSLTGLKENMDRSFISEGPSDCKLLLKYFSEVYKIKKNDVLFLNMLSELLPVHHCFEDEFYYNTIVQLHRINPSAESANKIAVYTYERGNYTQAAEYYQQAVDFEIKPSKKSEYSMGLAQSLQKLGNKTKSREAAMEAAKLNPSSGEPYILIGQLYAESRAECQDNVINLAGAVFWLAEDMFNKAKMIDPLLKERSDKLIMTYSLYFPAKEELKNKGIKAGDDYTIGCWINEKTTAR